MQFHQIKQMFIVFILCLSTHSSFSQETNLKLEKIIELPIKALSAKNIMVSKDGKKIAYLRSDFLLKPTWHYITIYNLEDQSTIDYVIQPSAHTRKNVIADFTDDGKQIYFLSSSYEIFILNAEKQITEDQDGIFDKAAQKRLKDADGYFTLNDYVGQIIFEGELYYDEAKKQVRINRPGYFVHIPPAKDNYVMKLEEGQEVYQQLIDGDKQIIDIPNVITSISINREHSQIAYSAFSAKKLSLFDLKTNTVTATTKTKKANDEVRFSYDSDHIIGMNLFGTINLFDPKDLTNAQSFVPLKTLLDFEITKTHMLFVGSDDKQNKIKIFNYDMELVQEILVPESLNPKTIRYSKDTNKIYTMDFMCEKLAIWTFD